MTPAAVPPIAFVPPAAPPHRAATPVESTAVTVVSAGSSSSSTAEPAQTYASLGADDERSALDTEMRVETGKRTAEAPSDLQPPKKSSSPVVERSAAKVGDP